MADTLILVGSAAYEPDDAKIDPSDRAKLRDTLRRMLSAARAGGFVQGDVLETLLARREVSLRVAKLAHAAVNAAGIEAAIAIVQGMNKR